MSGDGAGDAKKLRSTVQIVFQNPYGSLNPRQKVGAIIEEPLVINTEPAPPPSAAARRDRDMSDASGCGRSITAAIRTCSPAASASASRSPAR